MNAYEAVNWWWVGKRQLILKTLERLGSDNSLVLDIGCGTGSNLRCWESCGEVLGLDISADALNYCRIKGNENLIRGDAFRLPFHDNIFDTIVALDILEHIENDGGAVREFFRVCHTGGHLLLTVPALTFLWSNHDVALHHKRRYAKKQLAALLQTSGFHVEKITFWNFALLLPATLYRTLGNLKPPKEVRSDSLKVPGPANYVLRALLSIENSLILKGFSLPWGITLFAVCRKPKP